MVIFVEYSDLLTNQREIRRSMHSAGSYICYILKRFFNRRVGTFFLLVVGYLESVCSTSRNKGDDYVLLARRD